MVLAWLLLFDNITIEPHLQRTGLDVAQANGLSLCFAVSSPGLFPSIFLSVPFSSLPSSISPSFHLLRLCLVLPDRDEGYLRHPGRPYLMKFLVP